MNHAEYLESFRDEDRVSLSSEGWMVAATDLERELVQIAAVAVCWLEALGFTRGTVRGMIDVERDCQDAKWGMQRHSPEKWAAVLGEEVGEVCKAVLEAP